MNLQEQPHRRRNILTGEWVLVSPHRAERPWQGSVEDVEAEDSPVYDPSCYLCPGNERAGGGKNPDYDGTYVFTNDFAALLPDTPVEEYRESGVLEAVGEPGTSKVICYSPRHDLTMAMMETNAITQVVETWKREYSEIGDGKDIGYVQIFENKGTMMGCSNPHPHGQIWATKWIPDIPAAETEHQRKYADVDGSCMLCDYAELELSSADRVVVQNDAFAVVVPFWAVWPFETIVLPKRHVRSIDSLTAEESGSLADILRLLSIRYDNLFNTNFPYSMGIHQAPTDGEAHEEWHMHFHFYPPLLRSATVRKFMVGYEMLATPQRDITAEKSAQRLRELSDERYSTP